ASLAYRSASDSGRSVIIDAYGYAPARCILRRGGEEELFTGCRAPRGHAAGRQPADPRAREAARQAAPRSLRAPGGADRGGPTTVPERATDALAGGSASRGR